MIRADEISAANKNALAELTRRGVGVSLCSGRATPAARNILQQLRLDGFHIFFDGALVTNPGTRENLYLKALPRQHIKKALAFARENGIIMDLFSSVNCYMELDSWVADIRRQYFKVEPVITGFARLPENEEFIKGTLVVRSPQEKAGADRFRRQFAREFFLSKTRTPAYPDVDFINVLTPGVSKKTALEALMQYLGLISDEVMAIGDGLNDIPVIQAAGLGVAMGNAPSEVKAVARYVTGDVEHDGVAEAVRKFILD